MYLCSYHGLWHGTKVSLVWIGLAPQYLDPLNRVAVANRAFSVVVGQRTSNDLLVC